MFPRVLAVVLITGFLSLLGLEEDEIGIGDWTV
jgi:hypothetical protein